MNVRVSEDGNIGAFTFGGHNRSSVVDYCITNQNVFPLCRSFKVYESSLLSDHCLIELTWTGIESEHLVFKNGVDTDKIDQVNPNIFYYKWNDDRKKLLI